jgi:hypothetical protein
MISYVEPRRAERPLGRVASRPCSTRSAATASPSWCASSTGTTPAAVFTPTRCETTRRATTSRFGRPPENVEHWVEVKSTTGTWSDRGVTLSHPQFALAWAKRERYILAVVEHLYDPRATIHYIEDPARRVASFCYDPGWVDAADRRATIPGAGSLPAAA